jgi:hypothetical protein
MLTSIDAPIIRPASVKAREPIQFEPVQPIRISVQYELQGNADQNDHKRHCQRADDQFTDQW